MLCVWMCKLCMFVCLYECVCVCACVRLAHLLLCVMPVTGAITLSSRPATSRRGSARGREAPAGGRGWEKYPSKLDWWYSHAKPLNTLSPRSSLCLHYQPRRWEDMRRASLTPKANECEFPRRLSDGLSPSILWKSLISVVAFTELSEKGSPQGLCLKKHTDLLCFWLTFITEVQVALARSSVGKQWDKMEHPLCLKKFGSGKASLRRRTMSRRLYTRVYLQSAWDIQESKGVKPRSPSDHLNLCFQCLLGNIYSSNHSSWRLGMKRVDCEEDYHALTAENFMLFVAAL